MDSSSESSLELRRHAREELVVGDNDDNSPSSGDEAMFAWSLVRMAIHDA